jgi:uncharacterized Zn finger protein (UPF0148 family)
MPPRAKKPEPLLPATTIEDRCAECGWTLFVSLFGGIYCANPRCKGHQIDVTTEVAT